MGFLICIFYTVIFTEYQEPPVFVRKPDDKDVKENQRARFDVTVTGVPKPELTW